MIIVVVGCGRVGARLSTQLDQRGHRVSVVDINPASFNRLDSEFSGQSIIGTGIDEDVLHSAGIVEAEVFFAVTNADNTNLMAAQIAKSIFHIQSVSARVYDPVRAEIFQEMGINTICPTIAITEMMLNELPQ